MCFDPTENNLHDRIAARIADATPDSWEHVTLRISSASTGGDPFDLDIVNADGPDETADATEELLALVRRMQAGYEAKGESMPGILFEVTKRGVKRPNYMMSFAYDDMP